MEGFNQACSRLAPGGAAPSPGQEGFVVPLGALQPILCLLIALLIPCVVLLFLLDCQLLLLLRLRLRPLTARQRGRRQQRQLGDQSPPAMAASAPSSPIACHGPGSTPCSEEGLAGCSRRLPCCSAGAALPCNSRRPPRNLPPCCSQAQRRAPCWTGASQGTVSVRDLDACPPPVPPSTPATTSGSGGHPKEDVPPETHQHPENSSHQPPHFPPSHGLGPFRVRQGDDRTAPLNSANFIASLGPGMDSNFGASERSTMAVTTSLDAGQSPAFAYSLIWGDENQGGGHPPASLASPPGGPQVSRCGSCHRTVRRALARRGSSQALGGLEWDDYDPSYKRLRRPHKLPLACSKQYWL
ncbi:unnamed protein product [Natator depressus]